MAKIKKASELLPTVETDFIDRSLDDILIPVYRDVPYTEIENRAQMLDPEKNLESWFGVDRKIIQEIVDVQEESGPNGEKVFKPVNDDSERVRFIGEFTSIQNQLGARVQSVSSGKSDIEITFYGTGLNILTNFQSGGTTDLLVSVDGGTQVEFNNQTSDILANLGFAPYMVYNLAQGLSQGIHTVKISLKTGSVIGLDFYGYEIINETSTIKTMEGNCYVDGRSITLTQSQTYAYNSGFDSEYGTNTGDGGSILTYIDSTGTLKREIRWSDSSPQYLTSADHSSEEISRSHFFRQFGRIKTDDFGFVSPSNSPLSYFLDNNSSYLQGNSVSLNSRGFLMINDTSDFIIVGFYGTGLDAVIECDGTSPDTITVTVDGVTAGTYNTIPKVDTPITKKIVSGLPMGFHVVKFENTAAGTHQPSFHRFTSYITKTPELPSNSKLISTYYLNADFVANTTASIINIGAGLVRKSCWREVQTIEGSGGTTSWTFGGVSSNEIGGRQIYTDRGNAKLRLSFFGTGFEYRFRGETNNATAATVKLNGLALENVTNYPTATFSTYGDGGESYTASTGVFDMATTAGSIYGSGLVCSGLPLGHYEFEIENPTASTYLRMDSFDVITPTYFPKDIGNYSLWGVREVGNTSIGSVNTETNKRKNIFKAGTSNIGNESTTSTSYIPTKATNLPLYVEKDSYYSISYSGFLRNNTAGQGNVITAYCNGVLLYPEPLNVDDTHTAGNNHSFSGSKRIFLTRGHHLFQIYFRVGGGTGTYQIYSVEAHEIE